MMPDVRPHGAKRDALYGFSKLFVHDLDAMAAFHEEVFGLMPFNRHQDAMLGRQIDEITFQAASPEGSSLTLIKYVDSTGPAAGEWLQGFTTSDIAAFMPRSLTPSNLIEMPYRSPKCTRRRRTLPNCWRSSSERRTPGTQ
jgi:hypothetical protein